VEVEFGATILLDGYKEKVDYGERSDNAVLGGRDAYQKAWSLSSNLVKVRGGALWRVSRL